MKNVYQYAMSIRSQIQSLKLWDDLDIMIDEYQFLCSQEYIEFFGGGTCINQCILGLCVFFDETSRVNSNM